jgi:Skp family chaperone for outer membrane proteins
MGRLVRGLVVVLVVLSAAPAVAGNVGVLDAQRAVATVEQGKQQFEALEAWAKPRQEELQQLQENVVELTNQLNQQRAVASREALQELEDQLRLANRAFEDATRSYNRDAESKQRQMLAEVATRVGQVASEYAEANDFDVVLIFDAQPLVYLRESADITDTVIRLYNEKYPVD